LKLDKSLLLRTCGVECYSSTAWILSEWPQSVVICTNMRAQLVSLSFDGLFVGDAAISFFGQLETYAVHRSRLSCWLLWLNIIKSEEEEEN
jgi:hypothetical protein